MSTPDRRARLDRDHGVLSIRRRGGHPWRFSARHVRRVLASVAEKSK
jgi:hypothetical protein